MLKFKKIVVLLVILLLLVGIAVQVQASNTLNLDDLLNSNTTSNTTTNTTANTTTNTTRTNTLNVTTGNSIVQPNTNRAGSSGNSLPQTGVTEDITVMFFIVVCIIAAIYAYKKIRDYRA